MARKDLIQYRRGTAAQWLSANPILASGEVGFSTDANELRVGDGAQAWSELEPIGASSTPAPGSDLEAHINNPTPHKAYDIDMPNLTLLFENGIA